MFMFSNNGDLSLLLWPTGFIIRYLNSKSLLLYFFLNYFIPKQLNYYYFFNDMTFIYTVITYRVLKYSDNIVWSIVWSGLWSIQMKRKDM